MIYLTHRKAYLEYIQARTIVQSILDEQTILFQLTQPKSSVSDGERVNGGSVIPKADQYIIGMEEGHIKERLTEAKEILQDRKMLLEQVETELRKSQHTYDIIYTARWVDQYSFKRMQKVLQTRNIYYSRSQLYNIIKRIEKQIERNFKCAES